MSLNLDKIKVQRKQKAISQTEMANCLGLSRPSYNNIETGVKEPTWKQINIIAGLLEIAIRDLMADFPESIRAIIPKFEQVILQLIRWGGAKDDGKITKTKLAKLVYLFEAAHFHQYKTKSLGLQYRKMRLGPVADEYFWVIDDLYERKAINIDTAGPALMISLVEAAETAPTDLLNKKEIDLARRVAQTWQTKNTQAIVEFTHNQTTYKNCPEGGFIDYDLIKELPGGAVYTPIEAGE